MYFKNKTTGITWHITDETHIKRLKGDTGYEQVSDDKRIEEVEKSSGEPVQDSNTSEVDYKSIDWNDLRKIAADKGINTKGLKRDEIEKELSELGDANVTN